MARAGLDQQAVLQAAIEIADQEGLDRLTLATLAQSLGIRTPSLYNHVNGLPDLRNKLTIYGLNQLTKSLTRASAGKARDDAIRAVAQAYLAFAREHPGLYEATQRSRDWQDEEVQQAAQELLDLMVQIMDSYALENEIMIHTVRGFRSLLHGFAALERQGGFGIPLDVDVSFRVMIDTFIKGIYLQPQTDCPD